MQQINKEDFQVIIYTVERASDKPGQHAITEHIRRELSNFTGKLL